MFALKHYVAEHQHNGPLYSDEMTLGKSTRVHSSTGHFPFDLVHANAPTPWLYHALDP